MTQAWLVRPLQEGVDRFSNFKAESIIAIGWPDLPDLCGKDKNEIWFLLKQCRPADHPTQLGQASETVNRFVNEIYKDDIVVIPYKDSVYFAKVIGDYYFEPSKVSDGYPHQRKVEFLKGPVSRRELPDVLRDALRAPTPVADLTRHFRAIKSIVSEDRENLAGVVAENRGMQTEQPAAAPEFMTVSYPLRVDLNCYIQIPKDITKHEAERLAEFVKTLYYG